MNIAAGHRAWVNVLEAAPNVLKTMERVIVIAKEKTRKVKKADGVRLRFVKK